MAEEVVSMDARRQKVFSDLIQTVPIETNSFHQG